MGTVLVVRMDLDQQLLVPRVVLARQLVQGNALDNLEFGVLRCALVPSRLGLLVINFLEAFEGPG